MKPAESAALGLVMGAREYLESERELDRPHAVRARELPAGRVERLRILAITPPPLADVS